MQFVQKVKQNQQDLTRALAKALDTRDTHTLYHSENVANFSVQIAKKMNLSEQKCREIQIGALLHDIGKIGIAEHVLSKPGKLTSDEYELIKSHPKIGHDIIKHVNNFQDSGVLDIVLYHHEKFDGTGYPNGLKGENIPLEARIVAVADAYDAMVSKRIYKNEMDYASVRQELINNKGKQFDPEIVDVFLSLLDQGALRGNV
ncbi:HD-GYP domain-containing protein [Caldibacillus lycopersici]|uniref:HD-GYP domain-containing protein n=1 Tax=Perspicuibacillus lycopersici TaxID=1325689 RepID=A0AAE3LSB3_9BACI|nr:HD-GYP domain-containing protein [Perspicuibacillus lycopersici]MCU9612553.1 HD-GYP domain-containing protein [Perspicuibacillus lycopersici]